MPASSVYLADAYAKMSSASSRQLQEKGLLCVGLLLLSALPPCLWRRNLFGLLTGYGAESATVSVQMVTHCHRLLLY